MADQLDDLTNDQLRLRLVEFGMANMPVTSTTRKVLIKRLRTVMDGATSDKPKSSRRETIHVARFSSGDESESDAARAQPPTSLRRSKAPSVEKTNRRATIGVPSKAPMAVPEPPLAGPKPISMRRSSGRVTPSAVGGVDVAAAAAKAPVARAPVVATLVEDSDDEVLQFSPVVTQADPVRRQSRSPSMGKSETVVTSYKPPVKAPPPTIAEHGADADDDDLGDTSSDAEVRTYTSGGGGGGANNVTLNYSPPKATTSSKQYFSSSKTSTTSTYRSGASDYQQPGADLNVSGGRRFITSTAGAALTSAWLPSTPVQRTTATAAVDDLIVTDAQTPYLSDFTRRLSRLRAEPLLVSDAAPAYRRRRDSNATDAGDENSAAAAGSGSYAYRTSTRVHGRQSMAGIAGKEASAVSGNTLVQAVKRAIGAFEHRFRYQIWSVVVVLVAIFVFTLLFT